MTDNNYYCHWCDEYIENEHVWTDSYNEPRCSFCNNPVEHLDPDPDEDIYDTLEEKYL